MNGITFCTPIFKLMYLVTRQKQTKKRFKMKSILLHFVLQFSNYIHKCNVSGNQANAKVWHSEIAIS